MCPIYSGNIANMLKVKPPSKEEITFYREKKVCLVCKGKVSGFNTFICPSCDALYCEKCARALSLLENVCWVCKERIDPVKPVNPFNEEDELVKSSKTPSKSKKDINK